jgi:hypothetical protein
VFLQVFPPQLLLNSAARRQDGGLFYLGHRITALPHYHFISMHLTVHELSLHFTRIGMVDHRQVILFARCLVSSSLAGPLHLLLGSEEMLSINGQ